MSKPINTPEVGSVRITRDFTGGWLLATRYIVQTRCSAACSSFWCDRWYAMTFWGARRLVRKEYGRAGRVESITLWQSEGKL